MYNTSGRFKCWDCGRYFDEYEEVQEYRGECWGQPAYETMCYCPYCGGDFDEADVVDARMMKMLTMMQNWQGKVELNGVLYDNIRQIQPSMVAGGVISMKLYPITETSDRETGRNTVESVSDSPECRITVKQYMTRKASPDFDFMAKWNNDNPMPLRTMQGTIEKETRGMVYMHLHGVGLKVIRCMRCGKELTHPVSRHYGIGPECIKKVGIVADMEDVEGIKEQLENVTWEGWVIRSSILSQEEV